MQGNIIPRADMEGVHGMESEQPEIGVIIARLSEQNKKGRDKRR